MSKNTIPVKITLHIDINETDVEELEILEFSVNHDLVNNICARNIYIEQTKKLLGLTIKPRC